LTKPDSDDPKRTAKTWIPVFKNPPQSEFHLHHGYFVTKQPAFEVERTSNWNTEEKEWFNFTAPWSRLPSEFKQRMGIDNIVKYLTSMLSMQMKNQ
jgi:hypothetical protein